jgi:hypothetical protein
MDTYDMFLDENSKFSFKKYNEINTLLGLPPIKNEAVFRASLGINENGTISF